MTYKQFMRWYNERAADGCWGFITAKMCIEVIGIMQKTPFWLREKKWREYEQYVVENFVNPTNEKIREVFGNGGAEDG